MLMLNNISLMTIAPSSEQICGETFFIRFDSLASVHVLLQSVLCPQLLVIFLLLFLLFLFVVVFCLLCCFVVLFVVVSESDPTT